MKRSNEPILWDLFGAGGVLSALLAPILIFITGIVTPVGLWMPHEALDYTLKKIGCKRHVSGRELLFGIRDLALEQFGGLATMVFEAWGVRRTGDFGAIVWSLAEGGLMSRSDTDSITDFDDVYDFREAFRIDARPGEWA